jgi:2-dehydropantoate 2-reductase
MMGAGSLGTILGAYISKAGKQIDLIDIYEEHVKTLNEKGAHVVGTVDFTVPVKALIPDQMDVVKACLTRIWRARIPSTVFPPSSALPR